MSKFSAYVQLVKLRITLMQWITFAMGFWLGNIDVFNVKLFVFGLLGTGLVASAAGVVNQIIEVESDKMMERTKRRPLPAKVFGLGYAWFLNTNLLLAGLAILVLFVNNLTAALALATYFFYIIYTYSKKRTSLNTLIGAIPGAMAPLGGWAASSGSITWEAWLFFFILFIWQLPHFYAIAWMLREDYKKAGLKMISCYDPSGSRTCRQLIITLIMLLVVSMFPYYLGMLGTIYIVGATLLGLYFLSEGLRFINDRSTARGRRIMRASIIYLPLLLLTIFLDIQFMI